MRSDIEIGARFPDYELPDQDGVLLRLSDPKERRFATPRGLRWE
jgi:peroxiredoxin